MVRQYCELIISTMRINYNIIYIRAWVKNEISIRIIIIFLAFVKMSGRDIEEFFFDVYD